MHIRCLVADVEVQKCTFSDPHNTLSEFPQNSSKLTDYQLRLGACTYVGALLSYFYIPAKPKVHAQKIRLALLKYFNIS